MHELFILYKGWQKTKTLTYTNTNNWIAVVNASDDIEIFSSHQPHHIAIVQLSTAQCINFRCSLVQTSRVKYRSHLDLPHNTFTRCKDFPQMGIVDRGNMWRGGEILGQKEFIRKSNRWTVDKKHLGKKCPNHLNPAGFFTMALAYGRHCATLD